MAIRIAVPKETTPGERRVALVPEVVKKLTKSGWEVLIEPGAGESAGFPDAEFTAAGARIEADPAQLWGSSAIVLKVAIPSEAETARLAAGVIVVALMNAHRNLDRVRALKNRPATAFALELIPRITRAQSMDVLSSQATVAGYKAMLIGADQVPKFLPMLTTAAGTIRPAKALILGAGVAGLMAIATARRLGAIVEAYDVRRAAGEQVRSLGAKFLELAINAEGQGGYARELTPEEKAQEKAMVATAVAEADVIVTTAAIPGRKAPVLVTREMVERMRPGAVLVDLAAESGGNCELTRPGETVSVHGVTLVGPLNLPSQLPYHASQMFAKNLQAFLGLLITKEGTLVTDFSDEILAQSLLVSGGEVRHAPTQKLLEGGP